MTDWIPILAALGPVLVMLAIPLVAGVFGRGIERRHLASLAEREARVTIPVLAVGNSDAFSPATGRLVMGNAVLGTGAFKQFRAAIKTIFGGEIRSFQTVLDRARREAQLRMVAEAEALGATAIVNVRFETSDIGGNQPVAEVMCFGTMVR